MHNGLRVTILNIWRNGVHFTNLYSVHIVIIMANFSTIDYIKKNEKKSLIVKDKCFHVISSSFGFVIYAIL